MALGLFRFVAAVGRTQVVANTLGTFTLLLVFVLGGFIIAKSKQFWLKVYYASLTYCCTNQKYDVNDCKV